MYLDFPIYKFFTYFHPAETKQVPRQIFKISGVIKGNNQKMSAVLKSFR